MEQSPIIDVVKKVNPTVVSIIAYSKAASVGIPTIPTNQKDISQVNGGSGFIVSPDGLIFTNKHVISDSESEYQVITFDDKKYKAKVLGCDEINDVAILKIGVQNLPVIEFGDSSSLELGQTVIAFGNALGIFKNTISSGIISGLSRLIMAQAGISNEQERLRGLIQTDAAINPGNSGGPLCDIEGKVIGINAAMVLGAENIGFAIPINAAKKALEDIKKYGRIRQPFLGIRYLPLNKELQEKFNLPTDYGALVIRELPEDIAIIPGGTADRAGIKEKDIILECNDVKITEGKALCDIVQDCEVGKEITLKILRNGREKIIKTILREK